MHASFRVSLLYLLLIIPPHGNSPLPVMESWLQKDQDDGIVQRDMTSSLTGGDESFGTAHQTYQNSLIRKKKSDTEGELFPPIGHRKYKSELELNQLKASPLFDGRFVNQDFREAVAESARRSAMFEDELNKRVPNVIKYRSRAPSLRLSSIRNNFNNDIGLNRRLFNEFSLNPNFHSINSGWSAYDEAKDASVPSDILLTRSEAKEIRNMLNTPMRSGYPANQRLVNSELEESAKTENKDPQVISNEYYDDEANSLNEEYDEDYNEGLSNRGCKQKREDARGIRNGKSSDSAKFMMNGFSGSSVNEDSSVPEPFIGRTNDISVAGNSYNVEDVKMSPMSDPNLLWKLNSDLQSQALSNVVKNSQRALQEVQLFQQQLINKQQDGTDNEGGKRESRFQSGRKYDGENVNLDEKRLKREDEDEQKNMKTGTDEGGGGEYEDEEGKGHKDEEEYYEDADLSDDEPGKDAQSNDDQNEKSVKRETAEDDNTKASKTEQTDDNTQDYELNLENAPVENSGKSRKNSYREGEKTKVRKGVKIWDQWGKWSPCSVTCGVGRSTRWRHCIGGGCAQGEKEAQIKRCTNPAC